MWLPAADARRARRWTASAVGALLALTTPVSARAQAAPDPDTCRLVRLSDVGWTDVTATTAVLAHVLTTLGYEPRITVLSVPVTFASLRTADIDVFLGNWMPSQQAMLAPYVADGSIDVVATNLRGARYTLAVPDYLYDAGLRDFADIARFRSALGGAVYGIEAGNDANETLLGMMRTNALGLGGFRLVESSEQGMLAQVERAVRAREPIVFLGWAPHPMNTRFPMRYLSGGDAWFGPDFGGAVVRTVTRRGLADACPNVGLVLRRLAFTIDDENALMGAILDGRQAPSAAAAAWVATHPDRASAWLADVTPLPPLAGDSRRRGQPRPSWFETQVSRHKVPIGDGAARVVDLARQRAQRVFDGVSWLVQALVSIVERAFALVPAPVLILLFAAAAWLRRRSVTLTLVVPASLLLIMNLGYWAATIETLALVAVAATVSTLVGVPLGIVAAHRPAVATALRPVLDLMQTLPTFVYLTPTLVLFGLGVVPGLVATIVFALPAPIRLTQLGIASVPRALIEAGQAFGATPWQQIMKIELPSASSAILTGVSQCIMLSLSMVVIAALVGAGGLGVPVVRALNTVQVGMGIEAGLAIVLVAVILDRLARPSERDDDRSAWRGDRTGR